jgi:hypothetical protein
MNGPILVHGEMADGLEWAHCFSLLKLLMSLNGPTVAYEESCQLPQMDPLLLMRKAGNGHKWAYHCFEKSSTANKVCNIVCIYGRRS